MFCPNCGVQLDGSMNFCPNCGTKINLVVNNAIGANQDNMVMLVSLGTCNRATASALLQQICGYTAEEALLILDSAPITVARGLTDAQARYLAQAFAEYGLEVSIYDGNGWRDLESTSTSVWDATGALLTSVASALGLMSLNNRLTRDMIHRMDYPYRYAGTRPPVYRLHSSLRAAPPRRIVPTPLRPPVRHAPPPPPPLRHTSSRPAPPPPPPAHPAPARPAPPKPAPQPPRPAPGPARPAPQPPRPGGMPGGMPGGRPGGGTPGGRPGGGTGRRG